MKFLKKDLFTLCPIRDGQKIVEMTKEGGFQKFAKKSKRFESKLKKLALWAEDRDAKHGSRAGPNSFNL